jgi:hypothetical protein
MDIHTAIHTFFTSDAGNAAWYALIVMLADVFFGTLKSLTDGTFTLAVFAAFLRKHVMGRVFPIWGFLIFGYIGKVDLLTMAGLAAAAAYTAETIGSILTDWAPASVRDKIAALTASVKGNPVPTD